MPLNISKICQDMKESATLAISEKAKSLKSQGYNVINFGVGEPDFNTPKFIRDAVTYAVNNGYTKYTPVSGIQELKTAISTKLLKEQGLKYDNSQILISCGAKHSLYNCFRAILDPDDEVIIPVPCWVSYPEIVSMCGGKPIIVYGDPENDFLPKYEDILSAVSNKTKAIIINSPSNPIGNVWSKELITKITNIAVKNQFYIVSDEIYNKLIYDNIEHYSPACVSDEAKDITILINGVSKSYAMTGFRIGYAAGPKNVISAMNKYQSQTTTNATSFSQYAAKVAIESNDEFCDEMKDEFKKRRDALVKIINSTEGISCMVPQGAFYIMLNVNKLIGKKYKDKTINSSVDFASFLLDEEKVALVPGEPFYANGYCRISYALDYNSALDGVNRIVDFVNKLS